MLTPRTTTVNLPGGIRQTTTTRTVSVTLLPFIRSRKVYFKIEGLLPSLRHRPYFDGVDVSAWCKEESFQNVGALDGTLEEDNFADLTGHPDTASNLISDSDGVIEGSFFIPNTTSIRFRAGRREFKVLDWDATADTSAISKAYANYTAQGTLERTETTITTIRPPVPDPPIRRIDPIAQSFIIEKNEGAFITSVDVFMATKSSTVPLQVQIRPMVNGSPTATPVPGASKYILPASVNTSASPSVNNASSITNITFDEPVYVNGFQEYAVVLLAETDDYTAWTAVMTEYEVGSTSSRIMKQPSLGSFFKSQNGSTWTPDQSRDLMFRIKRAAFGAGSTGDAYFENISNRAGRVTSIVATNAQADPTIRVYHANHGLFDSSSVTISGATACKGITAQQLNTTHTIVDASDPDSYTIVVTGATSSSTGVATQAACFATENYLYNVLFANVNQMLLPEGAVDWSIKTTTGTSHAGSETPYSKDASYTAIEVNNNLEFVNPRVVASAINQTNNMSGNRSLALKAELSTTSDYISPVIDLTRLSVSLVGNRIDRQAAAAATGFNVPATYVAETDATEGSSIAKHLFVPVTLEQPATGLKVLFSANRPSDSYIELYYKAVESGSDAPLNQTDWVLATIDQVMRTDDDPSTFREYEYTINSLDDFNTFQLKVVFKSTNTSNVPRLRDFRAIALST